MPHHSSTLKLYPSLQLVQPNSVQPLQLGSQSSHVSQTFMVLFQDLPPEHILHLAELKEFILSIRSSNFKKYNENFYNKIINLRLFLITYLNLFLFRVYIFQMDILHSIILFILNYIDFFLRYNYKEMIQKGLQLLYRT